MARERERTAKIDEAKIVHDPIVEGRLLAGALVNETIRLEIIQKFQPEHFFEPKHRAAWVAMQELQRRNLACDLTAMQKVGEVDADYLRKLVQNNPEPPPNLGFLIDTMYWDYARVTCVQGPLGELVRAMANPLSEPSKVKALAKAVEVSLDTHRESTYFRDVDELCREIDIEITTAQEGHAIYAYGIPRLDNFEKPDEDGKIQPRMIPGTSPGTVTCITGNSGMGKSTVAAKMVLAMARNKRRVLYGAWEMTSCSTLKLLACMACGFARSRMFIKTENGGLNEEEKQQLLLKARAIGKYVAFMDLPFGRKRAEKKRSNDRNLDLIHEHISKSGCDVFVADLWARCLVETEPADEALALQRQQAIAQETKTHHILLHQQRLKDMEKRANPRPTREGNKGSALWVEIVDTMLGVHCPGMFKDIPNNLLELIVLKQRYGRWPQAIEFDWDPDTAELGGGKTIPYDSGAGGDSMEDFLKKDKR